MTSCSNCGIALEASTRFCPSCGTRVVGSEAGVDPLIGATLGGKYRVVSLLGAGSMGTVYEGEHIGLRKKIALKVLHPDLRVSEETLQRFQREGIAAGRITHPSAVQIFDFDRSDDGNFFLAMEFVGGADLKRFLQDEGGRLSASDAVEVIKLVLGALAEAHEQGIVHRDMKPENIMVARTASGGVAVKVLDFGLSKLVDVPLEASLATQPGRVMGTPRYMAPEQGAGEEVDARSDLYSVGLMLYELIAGELPFAGSSFTELLVEKATLPVPSLAASGANLLAVGSLDEVLARALARDRASRYATAAEMLDALTAVDLTRHVPGKPAPSHAPAAGRTREGDSPAGANGAHGSKPRLFVVGAVAVAVGAILILWLGFGRGGGEELPRIRMKAVAERTAEEERYLGLLDLARSSLRAGNSDEALSRVEEAHAMPCRDPEAFLVRGLVYGAEADVDTALADLREALALDPTYASAAAAMGWLRLDAGEEDLALARFEEARACDASSGEALAGLGALAHGRGEIEEARGLLEQAVKLEAECGPAHFYLGLVLLEADELQGAVDSLVAAKRHDPRSWRTYGALGEAYLRQGRPNEAESQFEEAIARNPGALEPLAQLVALYLENGRTREALAALEGPLRRRGAEPRLFVLQAVALEAEGQADEAIAALERAVEQSAADAEVHTLLGLLYQHQGELPKAIQQYDSALAMDSNAAQARLNRGLALFAQELYEESERDLVLASELDYENPFIHRSLGIIYMQYLGQAGEAIDRFRTYQSLGGDDTRVDQWIRGMEN